MSVSGPVFLHVLVQLNQHAMSAFWMYERVFLSARVQARRRINQLHPFLRQLSKHRLNVVDLEADVVDAFAAFLPELADRSVAGVRLEQLDLASAARQERNLDLLLRLVGNVRDLQAQCVAIEDE